MALYDFMQLEYVLKWVIEDSLESTIWKLHFNLSLRHSENWISKNEPVLELET